MKKRQTTSYLRHRLRPQEDKFNLCRRISCDSIACSQKEKLLVTVKKMCLISRVLIGVFFQYFAVLCVNLVGCRCACACVYALDYACAKKYMCVCIRVHTCAW